MRMEAVARRRVELLVANVETMQRVEAVDAGGYHLPDEVAAIGGLQLPAPRQDPGRQEGMHSWHVAVSFPRGADRRKLVVRAGQVLLLWLVITAGAFLFGDHIGNEVDVLPSAKQYAEHDWLPNDWYLNLDLAYRRLFDAVLGPVVNQLGFRHGAIVARLAAYLFLAVAAQTFLRAFGVRFSVGLVVLAVFIHHQSLVAGEWVAGGVETKTVAYAFVLLSCAALFRRRYLAALTFAGAAVSFHVLAGLYAAMCSAVALLTDGELRRSAWWEVPRNSWAFFATGTFGLWAAVQQLLPAGSVDSRLAWQIYVQMRNPHHLLPTWSTHRWLPALALATGLFVVMLLVGRSRAARFVAAYALASVSLFAVGLAIYAWGDRGLLRFYWFRFGDVMVPFMGLISVGLIVSDLAGGYAPIRFLPDRLWKSVQGLLRRGLPALLLVLAGIVTVYAAVELATKYQDAGRDEEPSSPMLAWIAANTPRGAVFLVDPTIDDFYIHAQRAMFVSFKHMPQSAADILEWYRRITLCNGGRPPLTRGFRMEKELQASFYDLDEQSIRRIADEYGLTYYLGSPTKPLDLECVHSTPEYVLYRVDGGR